MYCGIIQIGNKKRKPFQSTGNYQPLLQSNPISSFPNWAEPKMFIQFQCILDDGQNVHSMAKMFILWSISSYYGHIVHFHYISKLKIIFLNQNDFLIPYILKYSKAVTQMRKQNHLDWKQR
ncbi:Hypothetical_protein [Hexamita inflata]|uniref:Hypothetical_protein n=1 Tax=Hexamita inflata TaxID=28002 RepID=A0AA86V482_9EUKA|nr:Hypothetical protein HINF_LOCUS63332 [Hexamita inflata]